MQHAATGPLAGKLYSVSGLQDPRVQTRCLPFLVGQLVIEGKVAGLQRRDRESALVSGS